TLDIKQVPVYKDSSKYPIGLNITEHGDAMEVMLIYNHSIYDEERIKRMMKEFAEMIASIIGETGKNNPVSQH
ncbi:MAG: hypothetical protein GY757_31990, partial [bacterium]|nr:hypothetical protein [bacterium]